MARGVRRDAGRRSGRTEDDRGLPVRGRLRGRHQSPAQPGVADRVLLDHAGRGAQRGVDEERVATDGSGGLAGKSGEGRLHPASGRSSDPGGSRGGEDRQGKRRAGQCRRGDAGAGNRGADGARRHPRRLGGVRPCVERRGRSGARGCEAGALRRRGDGRHDGCRWLSLSSPGRVHPHPERQRGPRRGHDGRRRFVPRVVCGPVCGNGRRAGQHGVRRHLRGDEMQEAGARAGLPTRAEVEAFISKE